MTFGLGLAKDHDCNLIIRLVEEAAAWLRSKGTDQWAKPWPSRAARDARILADIRAGRTWIARDGDNPAATITSRDMVDQALAGEWIDDEPAAYVRRLVVARSYGGCGLGSGLLNWAGRYAAQRYGARWIRIDVWKTNKALHQYYVDQGFQFVSYCRDPEYPSGALFQKATSRIHESRHPLADDSSAVCSAISLEHSTSAERNGKHLPRRESHPFTDKSTCRVHGESVTVACKCSAGVSTVL
jgi:GNAT superfamily N-acetyltransferase